MSFSPSAVYVARRNDTYSTAITILQVTAGSAKPIVILRAWCNQRDTTTSAQVGLKLLRKTGTATVTALTPAPLNPSAAASSATAGYNASAEGTDGNIMLEEGFNILNGWLYLPVPEERIIVAASGIIALKWSAAPTSASYEYGIVFAEIG